MKVIKWLLFIFNLLFAVSPMYRNPVWIFANGSRRPSLSRGGIIATLGSRANCEGLYERRGGRRGSTHTRSSWQAGGEGMDGAFGSINATIKAAVRSPRKLRIKEKA